MSCEHRPCGFALAMARVPAKKWATREDLLARIELARLAILANPCEASLEQLAKEAGVAPHHFHRLFRTSYGQTPGQCAFSARINRAKELLETTDDSIAEITLAVGFSSTGTFCTRFKKVVGLRPSEYRESKRNSFSQD